MIIHCRIRWTDASILYLPPQKKFHFVFVRVVLLASFVVVKPDKFLYTHLSNDKTVSTDAIGVGGFRNRFRFTN